MIILYRYRLKIRHHISGEKTKHFSYPDYFTYPVCQHQGCGQRGPDNQGCTVSVNLVLRLLYMHFAEVVSGSGLELIKCGGRCGQASCAAHFASKEDLSQHIKMSRLLQCRHVRQCCVCVCVCVCVYESMYA